MDRLEFRFNMEWFGADAFPVPVADIYVNGEKLLKKIWQMDSDAAFCSLYPEEQYAYLTHQNGEDVLIGGCGCGVAECNPLYLIAHIDSDAAVWEAFRFVKPDHPGCHLEELPFPPFRFERKSYEKAVDSLSDWYSDGSLELGVSVIRNGRLVLRLAKGTVEKDIFFDAEACDPVPELLDFARKLRRGDLCHKVFRDKSGKLILDLEARTSYQWKVFLCAGTAGAHMVCDLLVRETISEKIDAIRSAVQQAGTFPGIAISPEYLSMLETGEPTRAFLHEDATLYVYVDEDDDESQDDK